MNERLYVYYEQQLVGEIESQSTGGMQFSYAASWQTHPNAFPVSLSLPLNHQFTAAASHSFFANLLPEGHVREQICKTLQLSVANDFGLLKAIGGDCAGALSITGTDEPPTLPTSDSALDQLVSDEQLAAWSIGTPPAFSAVAGRPSTRLSLAGAQDKLPVCLQDNRIYLPTSDIPSTYILKFPSRFYSHLTENEVFIAMLAHDVGLPVVELRVWPTRKSPIALIRRYDRVTRDGSTKRLHQEDFCQALGINPGQKYEKEGGPSLRQCVAIIRDHAKFPLVDLQQLLNWTFFNLGIGNADAHGKNLSLLYDDDRVPRLAPFYDLICTRNYKRISRELAMSVGGAWDPDLFAGRNLDALAQDFGIRSKTVSEQFQAFMELIERALPATIENYAILYGQSPVLQRLPIIIRKTIRRLRRQTK